jgi:hypothetical protein
MFIDEILEIFMQKVVTLPGNIPPVRLSLSARLISRGTVFFSHSKSATAGL